MTRATSKYYPQDGDLRQSFILPLSKRGKAVSFADSRQQPLFNDPKLRVRFSILQTIYKYEVGKREDINT